MVHVVEGEAKGNKYWLCIANDLLWDTICEDIANSKRRTPIVLMITEPL